MMTSYPTGPVKKGSEATKWPVNSIASWLRGHASLVGAFVAGGLALALYVRSVNFGFFGDDPSGHFR